MSRKTLTNEEMTKLDDEYAYRLTEQRRLRVIREKLEAAGLDLDELIELIEARQKGEY